jgi:hypothetical protein
MGTQHLRVRITWIFWRDGVDDVLYCAKRKESVRVILRCEEKEMPADARQQARKPEA